MLENLERFHPALTPQQVETILATSDAFGLWVGCKRPACRRSGACRGFAGPDAPHCVLRLILYFRVVLDAIGALLPAKPKRPPSLADELSQQTMRINKRMADLMEKKVDALARQAEAKERREERI